MRSAQATALDRNDRAIGEVILSRLGWDRLISDTHGAFPLSNNGTVGFIPISDEIARRLIPKEGLRQLA